MAGIVFTEKIDIIKILYLNTVKYIMRGTMLFYFFSPLPHKPEHYMCTVSWELPFISWHFLEWQVSLLVSSVCCYKFCWNSLHLITESVPIDMNLHPHYLLHNYTKLTSIPTVFFSARHCIYAACFGIMGLSLKNEHQGHWAMLNSRSGFENI